MQKRGLRVLTLSLGVLLGALLGARGARAQILDPYGPPPPQNTTQKPTVSLKVQLSSNHLYPLEPVGVVVTLTNNGEEGYIFTGWETVLVQVRFRGAEQWNPLKIPSSYFSWAVLKPHKSTSVYYPIDLERVASDIFKRPGAYEIEAVLSAWKDVHNESFAFEVRALPKDEELAASYLRSRGLANYFGVDKYSFSLEDKRNTDGTIGIGEPARKLQYQFQEFLLQFPTSRYAPWVKLAQFSVATQQYQHEVSLALLLRRMLGTHESDAQAETRAINRQPINIQELSAEEAQSLEQNRKRLGKIYGVQLIDDFIEGKPTLLHLTSDLEALEAHLVALAPTLPSPVDSRAWILAANIAGCLHHDKVALYALDEALATSRETTLPAEVSLRKTHVRAYLIAHREESAFEPQFPRPLNPIAPPVREGFLPSIQNRLPPMLPAMMPPHSPSLDRPRYAELPQPTLHATRP